jgi:hypothetical protein
LATKVLGARQEFPAAWRNIGALMSAPAISQLTASSI